jgi:hypothetical protein
MVKRRSRFRGLKHQKEKRSMNHFAGLDVSVKETSVCIVDETGKIVREVKVASEPDALLAVLRNAGYHFKRIGLEAGPFSQWLFSAPAEADWLKAWAMKIATRARERHRHRSGGGSGVLDPKRPIREADIGAPAIRSPRR